MPNGQIVTGKNSELFGPTAAALINAIKTSAGIDKDTKLIEPEVVKPIQGLKINHLGSRNPRLHSNEILIAWLSQLLTMRMRRVPWRNLVTSRVLKPTQPSSLLMKIKMFSVSLVSM